MSGKNSTKEGSDSRPSSAQMNREVEITITVKAFRGDPLPTMVRMSSTHRTEDGEAEDQEDEEQEEQGPPPTLEELECKTQVFNKKIRLKHPHRHADYASQYATEWSHTFVVTAMIDEDAACQICRSIDSSIALHKTGLDAPMLLLPLDFAPFVAGDKTISLGASLASTELIQNPYNITNFTVEITIDDAFLTPGLEARLNPLCVTIISAEDLPNHMKYIPMGTWKDGWNPRTKSLGELRQGCKPAYCQYRFMSPPQPPPKKPKKKNKDDETEAQEEPEPNEGDAEADANGAGKLNDWMKMIQTHSMPQEKNIRFKHKKVYMAGLMHPDDLIQHLKTCPLEIELHDRDRIPPPAPVAVGEDEQESATPPTWSGLKSIDKSRAAEPLPQDPFGVCTVNLMPLCDGRTFLVERANVWPKRIEYAAFSAHERPTKGDYLDCGSVLVVKVEVRQPLKKAVLYPQGPFQRVVYRFQYSNAQLLRRISELIIRVNAEALGTELHLPQPPESDKKAFAEWKANPSIPAINPTIQSMLQDGASLDMLDKALTTVELAPEHMQDPSLDIITGVQVIDSNFRIFILEGLAKGAILRLLESVPRLSANSKEFKLLYNQEITFPNRLYSAYNLDIKRIKLRETLHKLILKVDTYLEPKYMLTAWALMRLNEISHAGRMKKLRDLVLFPDVAQLEHMYKKLGDALSIEDLTGEKPTEKKKGKSGQDGDADMPALTTAELAAASAMPRPKTKAPTESQNPVYLSFLATKPPAHDFIHANIEAMRGEERNKGAEHELDYGEVYNYSGQYLQYGSLQSDFQRERYAKDYGKIHWTYSKDLISGAFVLQDVEQYERDEKKKSKAKFMTKEGFQWPKAREPKELQSIEQRITGYRKAELRHEWVENEWNDKKKEPKIVLLEGQPDFKTRYNTQPRMFETDPEALRSVFAADSGAALEAQERKSLAYKQFVDSMIVEDKRFHVLWNAGSDAISKRVPLLKDDPQTVYLKTMPRPEGCQPSHKVPGSMYTTDAYVDPKETYVVDSYGTFLHFEDKSIDDPTPVTRWTAAKAKGVPQDKERPAISTHDFRPFGNKTREEWVNKEKLYTRSIRPLTESDKPPLLYRKPQASNE